MEPSKFKKALKENNLSLSSEQLTQFEKYYDVLIEWNEKMNLTAIVDKEEVYLKHFYDSLSAAFYFDFNTNLNLCDVGAGAGFPSIPLKIAYPNLKVTIVDSLNKRITFLKHLADVLQLENVKFVHDRAELFGQNKHYRQKFDLVLARAVARMSVLSELCLPLVKQNGTFIAMKGANGEVELEEAHRAIKILGGKVKNIHQFTLPIENSDRCIIEISKIKQTPRKYPRRPGTPNKAPLN